MSSHDQGKTKIKKGMWLLGDMAINNPYELANLLQVGISKRGKGIHQRVDSPDHIFEFDEFVLVVEVSLTGTSNSRQEAAEGESVRRHVASAVECHKGKRVFGLFIANKVDTNTAETLRVGIWYKSDDSKMALQIVPVTLEQFEKLFSAGFASGKITPKLIQEFILDCLAVSKHDAPEWKREIERTVQEKVLHLSM